jgi:hypothetical protein
MLQWVDVAKGQKMLDTLPRSIENFSCVQNLRSRQATCILSLVL